MVRLLESDFDRFEGSDAAGASWSVCPGRAEGHLTTPMRVSGRGCWLIPRLVAPSLWLDIGLATAGSSAGRLRTSSGRFRSRWCCHCSRLG